MTELAFRIAQSGLDAQRSNIQSITNNLANANTVGFKKGRMEFADEHYLMIRQAGSQDTEQNKLATGLQIGTGSRAVASRKMFDQGALTQTNNPLDVGITGDGFFQATTADGQKVYTRAGQLQVDDQGRLIFTTNNLPLEPPITIPQGSTGVSISKDGIVSVISPGSTTPSEVGKIQLATFINPTGLLAMGDNVYKQSAASGDAQVGDPGGDTGAGSLNAGALESSNVNVVEELVNLIEGQRAYEINAKAISAVDQMLQYTNQKVG